MFQGDFPFKRSLKDLRNLIEKTSVLCVVQHVGDQVLGLQQIIFNHVTTAVPFNRCHIGVHHM